MAGLREILRACREGNEAAVIRLLGTDPGLLESDNGKGKKPLMSAAWNGQLGMARLLVQRGANVNAGMRNGATALHEAAYGGHEGIVALLLSKGADASTTDRAGRTSLMLASVEGHLGVVQMLGQHMRGQGLDVRRNYGSTALHEAAGKGHEKVVRYLLMSGADPTITDSRGRSPRAYAEERLGSRYTMEEVKGRLPGCVAVFEVSQKPMRVAYVARRLPLGIRNDIAYHHPDKLKNDAHSLVVAVWQWWEGELERRAVLYRATCLLKASTTRRDVPTSQVPTYLEARVAAGHAVPSVEVVSPLSEEEQQQEKGEKETGALGKGKATGERGDAQGAEAEEEEEEEERHAVVEYVMTGLNEELVTELLEGFHYGK